MTTHRLIAYTAQSVNGTQQGIAAVVTDHARPSWSECAAQITGYITGRDLGPAPMYTLRYTTSDRESVRQLDAAGVERIGGVVMRVAGRSGNISNIAVLDAHDEDVTFDFACFREEQ